MAGIVLIQPDFFNTSHAYEKAYAQADEAFLLQEYTQALTGYDRAISINSKQPDVWIARGRTLYQLEDYAQALDSYQKALELDSTNTLAWVGQGDALIQLTLQEVENGELSKAQEFLETAKASYKSALKLNPNNRDAELGLLKTGLEYTSVLLEQRKQHFEDIEFGRVR